MAVAPALTELSITLAPFPTKKTGNVHAIALSTRIFSAAQVDAWSAMIKRMALKARVRQIALHARFVISQKRKNNTLPEKALLTDTNLREQLEQHFMMNAKAILLCLLN